MKPANWAGNDWSVLLIGGGSGVGKTTLAPLLASKFGLGCSLADDFRLTLQRMTTPEQQPALHYFVATKDVWDEPPEALCERLIEVGKVVSWSLEVVVAHHLLINVPIVLEGDGILPSLAAQHSFAGFDIESGVRSVFLYEPEENVIRDSMIARGRGFQDNSPTHQNTQVRVSWLYGQWIREEAERLGLPVLEARPWATLPDRIIEVIR